MVQVFGVYPVQCLMHFKVWWKGETIVKDVTRLDPGPIFRNGLTNNTFSFTKRGGLKSVWGQSAGIAENTTVKRSSAISKHVSFWAGQIPAGQTSPKGTISEMAARAFYCCLYAMSHNWVSSFFFTYRPVPARCVTSFIKLSNGNLQCEWNSNILNLTCLSCQPW